MEGRGGPSAPSCCLPCCLGNRSRCCALGLREVLGSFQGFNSPIEVVITKSKGLSSDRGVKGVEGVLRADKTYTNVSAMLLILANILVSRSTPANGRKFDCKESYSQ